MSERQPSHYHNLGKHKNYPDGPTREEISNDPTNWPVVTSNFDNCILFNAVLKNNDPYDDQEVRYLRQLQGVDLQSVTEYYSRSEVIIAKMRELGVDNNDTWNEIDRLYIDSIIEKLKGLSTFKFSDIRNVLEQLELKYGVVSNV